MTRSLFFLTALAAMIAALTAIVVRLELARTGVSPLFLDSTGEIDGARFGAVSSTHSVFSYLTAMLLGTTMIAAAREKGARLAGLFLWVGIILCALTALLILSSEIQLNWFVDGDAGSPTGWVLYPPLGAGPNASVLNLLTDGLTPDTTFFDPSSLGYTDLSLYLLLPAGVLLHLGAFALLSTQHGFSWIGILGAVILLAAAALSSPMILSGLVTTIVAIWLLPALLFLACSAIRILDGGPSWLLVLGIGTLVTTLAYITVLVHPNSATAAGTIAEVATLYVFPLGLIWFALPALMLFRDGSRLTDWHIWAITGALTLGLILWLAPLFYAGQMGQPFRYVDYPDAFSIANLVSSMAVIAFTALMLGIIVILRRTRA